MRLNANSSMRVLLCELLRLVLFLAVTCYTIFQVPLLLATVNGSTVSPTGSIEAPSAADVTVFDCDITRNECHTAVVARGKLFLLADMNMENHVLPRIDSLISASPLFAECTPVFFFVLLVFSFSFTVCPTRLQTTCSPAPAT